ncbi:L,D-transpeptidase family protein [Alkalilimnicola ehrlichii]|uniref:L,D-transpeptidase family protein n=1 Tax=Alkalilimnicola ehrlichii TaxID=351052 RepID=UPI003BA039EC
MGESGSAKPRWLAVDLAAQVLTLFQGPTALHRWPVSTGRQGIGEGEGSGRTPRGWHRIRACIGAGQPPGAVFVGRRPTGEVYTPALGRAHPERDWILSRILWLCGEEPGVNRGGRVDTQRRYIYIHGCPDECPMGIPLSHGCIRMRNTDVIALFDRITPGTRVWLGVGAPPGRKEVG